MYKTVIIDCFPESIRRYRNGYGIVAIDVIRATTTAVTAVALGRRCFPVPSLEAALALATRLDHPLLVGELGGNMPYGFDMTNSPAELAQRIDIARSIILLSSSGTQLIHEAGKWGTASVACFRNYTALASYLMDRHERVAVIGAGTRGEFREEDEMCCAWIAEILMDAGYSPQDGRTVEIVKRWSGASPEECLVSRSVEYLRNSGQLRDLDFIFTHVNDLQAAFVLQHDELMMVPVFEHEIAGHVSYS